MNPLRIDDSTWNFVEQGAGPALLLVHGFPLDKRMWQGVASRLGSSTPEHRILCVDLPGFGQSTLGKAFTLESLADDLAELATQRKLGKFVLGGLSMGGYVAHAFASRHESMLAGLVLLDTKSAADNPQQKAGRDKMIDLARTGGPKAVADEMLGKMLSEQTIRQSPAIVRELRGIMESVPARTTEIAQAAMRDRADYTSLLPSLSVPVQIIVGHDDVLTPPSVMQAMAQAKPGADWVIVPDAGHLSPLEQPEFVADAFLRFLRVCFQQT